MDNEKTPKINNKYYLKNVTLHALKKVIIRDIYPQQNTKGAKWITKKRQKTPHPLDLSSLLKLFFFFKNNCILFLFYLSRYFNIHLWKIS